MREVTSKQSRYSSTLKIGIALFSAFLALGTIYPDEANAILVRQEIHSTIGVGDFSYDSEAVSEIQIGPSRTATIIAVASFQSFHMQIESSGAVYILADLVKNGAFFSPEFPLITGRIPRFGILEAATFETANSTVLELFFDVVQESANGILLGQSQYSISPFGAPPPIPEPEIYAMMLAGLGLVGYAARRRKK